MQLWDDTPFFNQQCHKSANVVVSVSLANTCPRGPHKSLIELRSEPLAGYFILSHPKLWKQSLISPNQGRQLLSLAGQCAPRLRRYGILVGYRVLSWYSYLHWRHSTQCILVLRDICPKLLLQRPYLGWF